MPMGSCLRIGCDGRSPGGAATAAEPARHVGRPLYLHRYRSLPKRQQGKVEDTLDIEEIKIQDVLHRRENCILLTGDAGSGKTTALYRFGLILVEQALQSAGTIRIPVYLTSVDISKSDQSLAVLSGNATKTLTPDKAAAFDTADLAAGNLIVFVDGLDEVGDDTERAAVFQKVIEFHQTYPECRAIIAARDYPFVDDLVSKHKTPRFRISPISFKQAEKMVVRLSRGHSLSKSETQETLRRLENIHGLQLNPLLVTVFVATSEYSRSDIPANITELFKKFTEVMLGRWGRTKGVAQQYHAPLKDFLLRQIAFQMHSRLHPSPGRTCATTCCSSWLVGGAGHSSWELPTRCLPMVISASAGRLRSWPERRRDWQRIVGLGDNHDNGDCILLHRGSDQAWGTSI